jgi:hypothetical protein
MLIHFGMSFTSSMYIVPPYLAGFVSKHSLQGNFTAMRKILTHRNY